jgi:hypothetical protein
MALSGHLDFLIELTDDELSEELRASQAKVSREVVLFLRAASKGCCFYSRIDTSFFAYRLDFEPGPGHVLLDATPDITGLVTLSPGVRSVPVPKVDYGPLEIFHIEQPTGYRNMKKVVNHAYLAEPYAAWMRCPGEHRSGDDVLIVTHKAMFDRGFVTAVATPSCPPTGKGER